VDTLRRLEIAEAVRGLKARYFRHIDRKEWDRFPECFVEDVEIDVTDDLALVGLDPAAGRVRGRDRFVRTVAGFLDGVTTVHHGHMPEIDVVDETTATGIWAMHDRLEFPDGRVQCGAGHYEEEYRLGDGDWRIARMRLTRLSIWHEHAARP
jgi:hypothetical protein